MKKTVLRRISAFALCLALVLGCVLPVGAAEDPEGTPYPVTGGNLYYRVNRGTIEITGCDPEVTEAVIPDEIDGVPVTEISGDAFVDNTRMTRVTLPAGYADVPDWEFNFCPSLTSIEVSEGNPQYCSVDGVMFSKDKTELLKCPIGRRGAYEIPEGVTGIRYLAFYCTGLTSVTVPASLTRVTLPVGPAAADAPWGSIFSYGKQLTRIEVSEGNPRYCSVDGVMFSKDKTELVLYPTGRSGAYEIPEGVTEIRRNAFYECKSLTRLTIPEGVKALYKDSIYYSNLESIDIPASVTSIQTHAISGCDKLTSINVAADNANFCSVDGVLFNKAQTVLLRCPQGWSGQYRVPDGVTEIATYAFFACYGLNCVELPEGVTKIQDNAFQYNYYLREVALPASVTWIGSNAFDYCRVLRDVYYAGTQAQWEQINIESEGNSSLTGATLYYNTKGPYIEECYPVTGGNIYYAYNK